MATNGRFGPNWWRRLGATGGREMIDPKVQKIIADAVANYTNEDYFGEQADAVANAIVGALAIGGFAIVAVDAGTMQRVIAEMSKKASG